MIAYHQRNSLHYVCESSAATAHTLDYSIYSNELNDNKTKRKTTAASWKTTTTTTIKWLWRELSPCLSLFLSLCSLSSLRISLPLSLGIVVQLYVSVATILFRTIRWFGISKYSGRVKIRCKKNNGLKVENNAIQTCWKWWRERERKNRAQREQNGPPFLTDTVFVSKPRIYKYTHVIGNFEFLYAYSWTISFLCLVSLAIRSEARLKSMCLLMLLPPLLQHVNICVFASSSLCLCIF